MTKQQIIDMMIDYYKCMKNGTFTNEYVSGIFDGVCIVNNYSFEDRKEIRLAIIKAMA